MSNDLRDEPVRLDVLTSEVVYEGYVWNVRKDRVAYGDGQIVREYIDHPGAVVVVAVDEDDRMLIIQQYRHPIMEREWELPAGLLDVPGEAPLEAAQRELAEEADLVAASWEPLISTHPSPGGNSEIIHLFLARGLSPAHESHDREAEEADIRVEWMPVDDVITAIFDGRMRNAMLNLGAFAVAQRRQRGR